MEVNTKNQYDERIREEHRNELDRQATGDLMQ